MKNGKIVQTAILLVMVLGGAQLYSADLSFRQAADQMLAQNPSFIQQKLEADMAGNRLQQAQGSYLPQVDFVQNWYRSNNPVTVFGTLLNQRAFTEANFDIHALNYPDPVTDVSSRFQLGWMLFDFGGREARVGSARLQSEITGLKLQATRTALLQELVRRYFALSLSEQRKQTAEEALTSARGRLEQARLRVEQGVVVRSDFLSAEVFAARREQEKIEAENSVRLARAALAELLGQPGGDDFRTAALSEREFPEHEIGWWQEQMNMNRPELEIVSRGGQLAGKQAVVARSGLLPSVQAWSSYEWHGDDLSYTGDSWGAGVELRWNLFRGFSDAKAIANANLGQKQAAEKERETRNALWLQLQSAYFEFQAARQKWNVARAALQQAEENRRIFAERYASGLVTIHDTLQAETAYNETRLLYSQNLFDLYLAYANLSAAAGRPDDILAIESASPTNPGETL